jgi:hypothetical protein
VALSFLYLAFLRTIQILCLHRSDDSDQAIEVVCSVTRSPCSAGRWPGPGLDPRIERCSLVSAG